MRKDILVFGGGNRAQAVARAFTEAGFDTQVLDLESASSTGHPSHVSGVFRDYEIHTASGGEENLKVAGMVAACESESRPNCEGLGMDPSERVLTVSRLEDRLGDLSPAPGDPGARPSVAFLLGVAEETSVHNVRKVLSLVPHFLDELKWRVVVLYSNLKVAGHGLEALSREMRIIGAVFLRYSSSPPKFTQGEDGRVTVECLDEPSGMPLVLHPELVVLDELSLPGGAERRLSQMLHAGGGPDGFLPSDNVRRLGHETNRRGIQAVPRDGDPLGRDFLGDDISSMMLHMKALERIQRWTPELAAEVDNRLCARCLTCIRSCPHGAIFFSTRIEISQEACFGCGICEAACPACAISLTPRADTAAKESSDVELPADPRKIVVFGCKRSAEKAMALGRHLGREMPGEVTFVPVECAGRISSGMLLEPFINGAAGVLVLACHHGNCHSEEGNLTAKRRVLNARRTLEEIGIGGERIAYHTLAANMGVSFVDTVRGFAETLEGLRERDS